MPIVDALYHHPTIRVITVRHEQGAAFMADGYARVTGKPAAILTLPGPGLTNAMTGIGKAFYDSQPMLILSTQVNREFIDQDRGLLHEMTHQFEMLQPLTKYGTRINKGGEIAAVFQQVMECLYFGRPRPVQIEIPRDIRVEMTEWPGLDPLHGTYPRGVVSNYDFERIMDALSTAKRPLIFAGGGTNEPDVAAQLVKLAERLGAPVLTSGIGVGAIPSDHPLVCGVPWIAAAALPRAGILACDMSLFWADMLAAFPIYQPRSMLFPWGFGTLGFAIPEAIGAKLAFPERAVVAIVGDGGFLFTGAELATAVQYKLNIPILVPNNHAYGMIKVQQRDQYDEQFMAVDLTNPDYVALAQAFGANGVKVTTPDAIGAAITQALIADKPTVIEIPWGWTWGSESEWWMVDSE